MDIGSAKELVKNNWRELLDPARKTGYVCPVCGNGSGPDGTGIKEVPKKPGTLHCFVCDTGGDIINFWMTAHHMDFLGALKDCCDRLGIQIDTKARQSEPKHSERTVARRETKDKTEPAPQSCAEDFDKWKRELLVPGNAGAAYLQSRGISVETALKLGMGFAPEWRSPKAVAKGKNIPATPRIIFPTSEYSYATRDIRPQIPEKESGFDKQKHGAAGIFNARVLSADADEAVFVVEGGMDAASLAEIGYDAVAIGGTSGDDMLVKFIERNPIDRLLILALDNDAAGKKASKKLYKKLKEMKDPPEFQVADETVLYLGEKDANDALKLSRQRNDGAFQIAVKQAVEAATKAAETELREKQAAYEATASEMNMDAFSRHVRTRRPYIPTGYGELDRLLDGGLYPGLYIVGAISALGKTTFCLQMVDHAVSAGQDVLIFTLEMSQNELMAKTISRYTYLLDMERTGGHDHAKTTRGISFGHFYSGYSQEELDLIEDAKTRYARHKGRIYIHEGVGNIGVLQVRAEIEKYIRIMKRAPLVLIDYLQILAPYNEKATDKQNADKAILELKRMTRDLGVPALAISSFNRESYNVPVSMSSFKESGMIEFGSDICIGLQYDGMDWVSGETEKERLHRLQEMRKENKLRAEKRLPISVQVKLLKNRNGLTGDCLLDFIPAFNVYLNRKTLNQASDGKRMQFPTDF